MASLFLLGFLFFFTQLSFAEENVEHPRCSPFPCGILGPYRFPFTSLDNPSCGVFPINCSDKRTPKIKFKQGGYEYKIVGITQANSVVINDIYLENKYFDPKSCGSMEKFSIPAASVFSDLSIINAWSLFNCSHGFRGAGRLVSRCGSYDIYNLSRASLSDSEWNCSEIVLPVNVSGSSGDGIFLSTLFAIDISMHRECDECFSKRKGMCGSNSENKFICLDEVIYNSKSTTGKTGVKINMAAILIATGCVLVGAALLFMLLCKTRMLSWSRVIFFWPNNNKAHQNIETFLKNYGPLQLKRYSYLDVRKMTKSFEETVGKGGFGEVYKGKLKDGSLVAIKMLNQKQGDTGEGFINEVATISRTAHINIVALLGFCFEGEKRALIYEFMPNGSLEKFVFDETVAAEDSHHLNWEKHYQISLGIARGLEYLHRGCNTRIVHFDIKPHNILLDADFIPKISDFGLAKICNKKESVISMLIPRGTMGYIAPEVFSRNFGEVSHKSDVYSYGMMVLEMVGRRRNLNVMAVNTSEIYFPHWIYKRLELCEDLGLKNIINEDDESKVKKMIVVSLWCIQTDPSNRPTMNRVIEMLNGSLESLSIPPKPLLSSPSILSPPHLFESKS